MTGGQQLAGDWVEAWESAAEAAAGPVFSLGPPPATACPVCDGDPDCHQIGCQPAC